MRKSDINPMPEYFDRYIALADDVDVLEAMQISLTDIDNLPLEIWKSIGDRVYAEGKWTIKQILQHLLDTERILMYRAVAFARGEASVPPFDEDAYAREASVSHRTLEDLIEEMKISRRSAIALYRSFTTQTLQKTGLGFKGPYSVLALGFMMVGHQRWHCQIIQERYL
jgi:hypothetical protein